jgi:hypothetical protein
LAQLQGAGVPMRLQLRRQAGGGNESHAKRKAACPPNEHSPCGFCPSEFLTTSQDPFCLNVARMQEALGVKSSNGRMCATSEHPECCTAAIRRWTDFRSGSAPRSNGTQPREPRSEGRIHLRARTLRPHAGAVGHRWSRAIS